MVEPTIKEMTNLTCDTFNEHTEYHVLPSLGPQSGYIRRWSREIKGTKLYNVQTIRDRMGYTLIDALVVYANLKTIFDDNYIR